MSKPSNRQLANLQLTDNTRALLGFVFGLVVMTAAVQVFTVNAFDFDNMQRGVRTLLSGTNPWAVETRIPDFYNPPFSILFLWPMLFITPKILQVVGGSLLFAFVFYQKSWVALAWFGTNSLLYMLGAGGIDMYVIGAGLLLLSMGDKQFDTKMGILFRVLGYGFLLIKPQGGMFIVLLYLLTRKDWKGALLAAVVYGLCFPHLYLDWVQVVFTDAPDSQIVAAHSLWGKFGAALAITVAVLVILARRWKYWELGGILAGVLAPYGMPGMPILMALSAVHSLVAIPIVILFSGGLAVLTWRDPPPLSPIDFYEYTGPFMAIYHLGMLGFAIALACLPAKDRDPAGRIAPGDWLKSRLMRLLGPLVSRWKADGTPDG